MRETLKHLSTETAKLAATEVWPLRADEAVAALTDVWRVEQNLALLRLRLVRQVEALGVPPAQRFSSTASWLRARLHIDLGPAREWVRTAALLERRPVVAEAVPAAAIDIPQAAVIAAAVDDLPAQAGDEVVAAAETTLIRQAADLEPARLRRVGERVLEQVAPHLAAQTEREALDAADARAHTHRSLTLTRPDDGQVRIHGTLTVEDTAIVAAALDPLCLPRPGDDRNAGQRRADALVDICRLALRTRHLPDNGGAPAQLAVTVPFDVLAAQLAAGTTDTGHHLAPAVIRRWACDAQLLPVVLGGAGQILDAGRTRRLATGAIRRAVIVRDRGCTFPSCDRQPRWCDIHHLIPWSQGGATALDNLVLLCRHHHRVIHDGHWQARLNSDRLPEFVPPPWIDLKQQPRHNNYHQQR